MKSNRPFAFAVTICLLVIGAASCKKKAQAPDQTKKDTAKWVAVYRAKASLVPGAYITLFSYNAISVVSPKVVFVAADYPDPNESKYRMGLIVRTTDGGDTWKELPVSSAGMRVVSMNGVSFVSPTTGWAVGVDDKGNGVVLSSTDGGQSWTGQDLPVKEAPTSIHFIDSKTGLIVGATPPPGGDEDSEGGPSDILLTMDAGKTWAPIYHLPVSMNAISFVDAQNGWIAGVPAAIYRTSDGGRTWDSQTTGLETMQAAVANRGGFGVTAISLRATDGVQSPSSKIPKELESKAPKNEEGTSKPNVQKQAPFDIQSISFADTMHGWAVAQKSDPESSIVIATSDGGRTWAPIWLAQNQKLRSVLFVSPTVGWVATEEGGYVYRTESGGRRWELEPIDFEQKQPIYRLGSYDAANLWAVGGGAIYHRVP